MANSYIATKGERLDSIVNRVLGDLNEFESVLENNPHLQGKIFLSKGDVVSFNFINKKEFSVITKTNQITDSTIDTGTIQIEFKEPLPTTNQEENLKALW